jgi:ketosteroid isomerase-like protein
MTKLQVAKVMFGVFSALLLVSCSTEATKAPEPPDTRAAEEAAIRKADSDWAKAAQTKSVDAFVAFYADNAVVLPPNEATATTKESIRKTIGALMGLPGLNISWQASKVEVAKSGDIGYLYGTYDLSFTDKGKTISDKGKILEIWKKQADGSWKCIVDTWNSDMPMAPPAK